MCLNPCRGEGRDSKLCAVRIFQYDSETQRSSKFLEMKWMRLIQADLCRNPWGWHLFCCTQNVNEEESLASRCLWGRQSLWIGRSEIRFHLIFYNHGLQSKTDLDIRLLWWCIVRFRSQGAHKIKLYMFYLQIRIWQVLLAKVTNAVFKVYIYHDAGCSE